MVYYITYQDYIIKELCIQKEDQQGCNGKCYLMKKLTNKVSDNNTTTPPQDDKKLIENLIFLFSKNSPINFIYISDLELKKIAYKEKLKDSFLLKKETPPPKYFI